MSSDAWLSICIQESELEVLRTEGLLGDICGGKIFTIFMTVPFLIEG